MGGTGNVNLDKPPLPKSNTWTPSASAANPPLHLLVFSKNAAFNVVEPDAQPSLICGLMPFYCSHFHPKEECVSNLAWNQISKCSFQTTIKCQIWFGMRWLPPCWLLNTCAFVFRWGLRRRDPSPWNWNANKQNCRLPLLFYRWLVYVQFCPFSWTGFIAIVA